ncbi:MAG: DUF2029 domain-containing protein [Planctomycetota bacterium]|nr:MAG: DUF2029 domain-containing protein [Planctomycetota bacterium]
MRCARSSARSRCEPVSGWRWRRWAAPVAAICLVAGVSLSRGLRFEFDFHHFYRDARYVWEHAALNPDLDGPDPLARRQLPFYLPTVSVLLAPMTAAGRIPAAILWTIMQVASLVVVLAGLKRRRAGSTQAGSVALLLAAPALFEAAKFNQLTLPILAMATLALRALERSQPVRAGFWLALAAVVKLLPAVFLLWLVRQGRFKAGAAMTAWAALLALVPPLLVLGPAETLAAHRQWWSYNAGGAAASGLNDPTLRAHFNDHRNQSLAAVLGRCCWREHPHPAPLRFADLSPQTCARVAQLVTGALLVAALYLMRPIREGVPDESVVLRCDVALSLLLMLIVAPLLRTYYLLWALPAIVLFCESAARRERIGRAGAIVWLAGMAAWLSDTARTYGVHLTMLICMAGLLLVLRRAASEPTEHDAGVVPAEAE